ncbi:MAG: protein kinase [Acidobacteriaceae bacterium]|nr:protein kinase [Acidobacteriaceae bacterium]MBV9294982.1 protein kinase [Acidobacteriaceae bacterium]MBV9766984.1 protein kinase [Acidobacteriaceae bacterium]
MPFEAGKLVGDYEVLALLGKGGMGRVYQVRHVISKRVEAMKVLLDDVSAEAELGDRFDAEIRTVARLDHPNIAKLYTAFRVENKLVMVMELVQGFTLSDRISQGPIPLEESISYLDQVLAALTYAHGQGVIHRDIKPSNIMVTSHGIVKLLDFGIAKSNVDPVATRTGVTMGSMLYMSPEQVRGEVIDARSDIYSAGVVLYELSAGRRPFEADNTFGILEAQLNTVPKPPLELNPALPKPLNDVIMTALAKEPMHRFKSAEVFRKALESVRKPQSAPQPAATAAAQVQPIAASQASARGSRRGLWMAAGAIACVCVLAGGAMLLPHFWRSSAASKNNVPTAPVSANPAPATIATPVTPAPATVQQNQTDNASSPTATPAAVTKTPSPPRIQPAKIAMARPTAPVPVSAPPPPQQASPAPVVQPAGPSQEEIEKESDELIKARARADGVYASLNRLRQQQAADGLELRQDMASAASRLGGYLQAADRALQSNNLESARKNRERAEQELTTLENFLGR